MIRRVLVALLLLQQRPLGSREIILGKLGNLLEQLRAALVVEIFGRELLRRPRQSLAHVAHHLLPRTVDGVRWRAANHVRRVVVFHASRAQRNPLKICLLIG